MTAFEDFVNLELPKRATVHLSAEIGYTGDPNLAVNPALNLAPEGRNYFWDSTNGLLWHKAGPTSTDWVIQNELTLATHADKATVPTSLLSAGRVWTVDFDGTQWEYTGAESGAPDPAEADAWDQVGAARKSYFATQNTLFSITVFIDQLNGDDVFNDGSTGAPFKTGERALAIMPEEAEFTGGLFGLTPSLFLEYQGGSASKADFSNLIFKFAKSTPGTVEIIAERSAKDLDGLGTTEFASAVFNRDLTGPHPAGGSVAKQATYRLDIGVTVLPAIQQPINDGDAWIFKETDFGFPGFRSLGAALPAKAHDDGGVLGAQDITLAGGGFDISFTLGDLTNIMSDFVTQVDGDIGFDSWKIDMPESIKVRFFGFDFATDMIFHSKFNGTTVGNVEFKGCKFAVGKHAGTSPGLMAMTARKVSKNLSHVILESCAFLGVGGPGGNSAVTVHAGESAYGIVATTVIASCVFDSATLILGAGQWDAYSCSFRGAVAPQGNNGLGARVYIGATETGTGQSFEARCKVDRCSFDFERTPGDGSPMLTGATADNGGAIVIQGATSAIIFGGAQGSTSCDIDGRWLFSVYGAQINVSGTQLGSYTRPNLYRTGTRISKSAFTQAGTDVFGPFVNANGDKTNVNGGDVQFGASAVAPQLVFDHADMPANDLMRGDDSEGVVWH